MNARSRLFLMPVLCVAVIVATASVASACPSCEQALGADASQGDLAKGLYYSILFMMSMPFAIIGAFAGLAYRAVKREQRRKEAEAAQNRSQPDES